MGSNFFQLGSVNPKANQDPAANHPTGPIRKAIVCDIPV